ncbi:hypothetical protein CEXT_398841 [Caerostris extrusa]|uniref:Uncharacterized protein n=1 Tax=Caerostris extrusa TaxID=172846 RepID=A0AAV4PP13_CAEEX|nr:hypothetical protein CEXT_398841 [Caerostris extrusa]
MIRLQHRVVLQRYSPPHCVSLVFPVILRYSLSIIFTGCPYAMSSDFTDTLDKSDGGSVKHALFRISAIGETEQKSSRKKSISFYKSVAKHPIALNPFLYLYDSF